jgi:7,8-dihydropterin-6-yl-methyl-4-(beta-D-ribofuranosyl)aminobenzene 5'-phosphate synthase
MTIVFDNYPGGPGLENLWGFAALLQLGGQTILFDTGSNGRVLLRNMAALGLSPESVDLVFLSHPHWDHMGGLDSVLELAPRTRLVVHEGFSKHLIHDLRDQCAELIVMGPDPMELAPGVWSTGLIGSEPPEHAMVIDTGGVTAAVTGCAHPGIGPIVQHARRMTGSPIHWAIGGFHLMYAGDSEIREAIETLQALGVARVVPTHCTGDQARAAFRQAFGPAYIRGGVGTQITLTPP